MTKVNDLAIWDYKIKKKDLADPKILKWYLERKISLADWENLDKKILLKNLGKLDISPYLKQAIKIYFSNANYPKSKTN